MSNNELIAKAKFPPKFKDIFKPKSYKVFYGGRGGGKTWACARALLIMGYEKPLKILCVREVMASIAKSVHATLKDQIYELGLEDFYTVEETRIFGKEDPVSKRRTEFIFAGIKNDPRQIKSTEGVHICWCEESDNISQESWELLIPTVIRQDKNAKRRRKPVMDSEIWISFNPNLESDNTYQRWVVNPPPGETLLVDINYWDNPWLPSKIRSHIEHMKATDYDTYKHVYEGYCRKAAQGAVYGKELTKASDENWIKEVRYSPGIPVFAGWDLGWGDATAVWFAQQVDGLVHIIDYIEHTHKTIEDTLNLIRIRCKYDVAKHYLPHDGKAHHFTSKWTAEEILRQQNLSVAIVPKISIEAGINAVRSLWPLMRFDKERCTPGIDRLRYYKYEERQIIQDGMVTFSEKPAHETASHASDALRYLAIALRPPKEPTKKVNYNLNPFGSKLNIGIQGQGSTSWMS